MTNACDSSAQLAQVSVIWLYNVEIGSSEHSPKHIFTVKTRHEMFVFIVFGLIRVVSSNSWYLKNLTLADFWHIEF